MSFHLFIAISFYLNIECKNIVCELGLKVLRILKFEYPNNDSNLAETCLKLMKGPLFAHGAW